MEHLSLSQRSSLAAHRGTEGLTRGHGIRWGLKEPCGPKNTGV